MNKKYFSTLVVLAAVVGLTFAVSVSADTSTSTKPGKAVITGGVTSIDGNILYVLSNKIVNKVSTTTTYKVDATNAKILQGPNTISVSDIEIDNKVIVQGTLEGNSISASLIIDQNRMAKITEKENKPGFFAKIGGFFSRLFRRN